jgi:hypothetical protein
MLPLRHSLRVVQGSLYDIVIKRRESIGWKTIVGMARDAAAGILHLHCEHVIHRVRALRTLHNAAAASQPTPIATRVSSICTL